MLAVVAGLLGLALGSFANVVIGRVPEGKSVVSPPSACPRCDSPIRARHNVPVIGWLWLRGRCADCGEPISPRYPLVEAGMGVLFAVIAAIVGLSPELVLLLVLMFFSVVLTIVDVDHLRLPDPIVLPFAIASILAVITMAALEGDWWVLARAGIGAAALGLFYFGAFFAYPKGMGFGDVKLAFVLGAVLGAFGWSELAVGAFAAFVWGSLAGIAIMVARGARRGVKIPFGPWMFVGAWTGIVAGGAVAPWYLSVTGVS